MKILARSIIPPVLGAWAIAGWAVAYQAIKQHGRLLARIDSLESRIFADARPLLPLVAPDHQHAAGPGDLGLPVGTVIPPFELPDFTGKMIRATDFAGRRLLLVHWSPACGFCELIADDLAALQPSLVRRDTSLVLISDGDVETNRRFAGEHGLTCPVLLQDGSPAVEVFRGLGTPAAYLADESGAIVRPLALGSDQVPLLAREAAEAVGTDGASAKRRLPGEKSLQHSRIEREGLKSGTPAPLFMLPEVRGGTVALEDFRGRQVLLVFSSPDCGPCDLLAPRLVELHNRLADTDVRIVMVGRGTVAENLMKAQEHGMDFPVVVQDHWKLSKEYGIFATPVAFLIDANGTIVRDVAWGVDQVLELGEQALVGTG
jgi:peroxiredoxin